MRPQLKISLKSDRRMSDKASNNPCLVELEDAVLSGKEIRKIRKGKKDGNGQMVFKDSFADAVV